MKNLTLFLIALLIIVNKPTIKEIKTEVKKIADPVVKAEEVSKELQENEDYYEALHSETKKDSLIKMIRVIFKEDADTALAIAQCESGIREDAIGDHAIAYMQDGVEYGKSYGIFQIRHLPGRPEPEKLLNASFNIDYAYQLFQRSGFQPWSAFTNGCYLNYL